MRGADDAVGIIFSALRSKRGVKSKPFCDRARKDRAFELKVLELNESGLSLDAIAIYLLWGTFDPRVSIEVETILRLGGNEQDVDLYIRETRT